MHDCMWARGQGGRPRNSLFQSLSVDMTPLPAVLKLLQHTPSFLFPPPHSLFLSDLVPGSWESSGQLRWHHTSLKILFACLPPNTWALFLFLVFGLNPSELLRGWITRAPIHAARYAFTHSYCAFSTYTHLLTPTYTRPHIKAAAERAVGVHDLNINLETKLQTLRFAQLAPGQVHVLSYFVQHEQMKLLWCHRNTGCMFSIIWSLKYQSQYVTSHWKNTTVP